MNVASHACAGVCVLSSPSSTNGTLRSLVAASKKLVAASSSGKSRAHHGRQRQRAPGGYPKRLGADHSDGEVGGQDVDLRLGEGDGGVVMCSPT